MVYALVYELAGMAGTEIQGTGNLFWRKIGPPICLPICWDFFGDLGAGLCIPVCVSRPLNCFY